MAISKTTLELNSFVKGLVTEASPLTFPDNASLDEVNFILNKDGSRQRRLGLDVNAGLGSTTASSIGANQTFIWKNVGGDVETEFLVIQRGSFIDIYDIDDTAFLSNVLASFQISSIDTVLFSFAYVDGRLVVAAGSEKVHVVEYKGGSFTQSSDSIKIRDFFGVESNIERNGSTIDLLEGSNTIIRPDSSTDVVSDGYIYNLRNQTFGVPRLSARGGRGGYYIEKEHPTGGAPLHTYIPSFANNSEVDPITLFGDAFLGANGDDDDITKLPAMTDSVVPFLYPNTGDDANRTGDRYYADDAKGNRLGTTLAPRGMFIIDALNRGESRLAEVKKAEGELEYINFYVNKLPLDKTEGGAKCITECTGRVFYAGFGGNVTDGDKYSPNLASYVMYSRSVTGAKSIFQCYQEGDPTTKETPDIIDTDGGYIKIDGAYNIVGLENIFGEVIVIAENGVWAIRGGRDTGFLATSNKVQKIIDRGCESPRSIVNLGDTIMYWGEDGIYVITKNELGDYAAQSISQNTIQTLYDNISNKNKKESKGFFDPYDNKVRWSHGNEELIFDLNLSAFYKNQFISNDVMEIIDYVELNPYSVNVVSEFITVNGEVVTVEGVPLETSRTTRFRGLRTVAYLVKDTTTGTSYIASFNNADFEDWATLPAATTDAAAYWIGGFIHGGDFQRDKQVPYVTFHFKKTEDGFDDDMVPTGQSSAIVSSQWDWANSPNSNKWSRPFQAYRIRRGYFPTVDDTTFDNGYEVVETKNKLRGKGKVVSIKVETEPKKDIVLLGMSMLITVTQNV